MKYKQKIKVNMSGKDMKDLTEEQQKWLKDNYSLLRLRIVEIVKNYKESEVPYNSCIARELFPPNGDNDQNFTCTILKEMDGKELISKKDGKSRSHRRRWRVNPHWHPK